MHLKLPNLFKIIISQATLFKADWRTRLRMFFIWPYALVPILAILLIVFQIQPEKIIRSKGIVESATTSAKTKNNADFTTLPKLKADFSPVNGIGAKSFLIYDSDSGKVLASHNADLPLPIASLTKLTTALLVARNLSPEQEITVNRVWTENLPQPVINFYEGEVLTVRSLTEAMLVASANDATQILAYSIGGSLDNTVQQMNDLAKSLTLKSTFYTNPTGLDQGRAYSTAGDLLIVVQEVQRNPWLMNILSETTGRISSIDGLYNHSFRTTNRLLRSGTDYITGGKTGYTENALGSLVVFANSPSNTRLIGIILGSVNREAEMAELMNWVFNSYNW